MKIDCIIGIDPGSNGGIVVGDPTTMQRQLRCQRI